MASVQGVYIALFGRPADPAGLAYFNGVTSNGGNLSGIGDLAGQKEYTDRFSGMSNTGIINAIYHSLFNRDAEPTGLEFFSAALTKGTLNINNIAIAILDGAQGDDKMIIENKLVAADMFTKSLDTANEQANYSGNAAADAGRAFLMPVSVGKATIPSQAAVDNAITGIHDAHGGSGGAGGDNGGTTDGNPEVSNPGKLDIVLTTGNDIISPTAASAFRTTDADDIISANHLNLGAMDKIDGGLGNDSFILTAKDDVNIAPELTGVEKIFVTALGTGATSNSNSINAFVEFDLDKSVGYKEVWNDSGADGKPGIGEINPGVSDLTYSNIGLGTTLGLKGTISDGTSFIFKDAGGVSDSATLVLDAAHDSNAVNITDIENLTINVKSASEIDTVNITSAKTVTITGNGDFTPLHFATAAGATIDASAHTGHLTLSDVRDDTTVKGGSSSDSFTVFLSATGGVKMTGGAGSDLFTITSAENILNTANAEVLKDVNVITDFNGAKDLLQIGEIGAKIALTTTQTDAIGAAATLTAALNLAGNASAAMATSDPFDSYSTFLYKGDTYVYHDNGHDGYNVHDGVVQLVGFTGTLDSTNFVAGAAM